jgi:hypothetical protein
VHTDGMSIRMRETISRLEDSQRLTEALKSDPLIETLQEDLTVSERHAAWARNELDLAEKEVKASQRRLEARVSELKEKIARDQ